MPLTKRLIQLTSASILNKPLLLKVRIIYLIANHWRYGMNIGRSQCCGARRMLGFTSVHASADEV